MLGTMLWLVVLGGPAVEVHTPEGTVRMEATLSPGMQHVSQRAILREVDRRLDRLEDLLRGLRPPARRRAHRLVEEIRGLLALLPGDVEVVIRIEEEEREREDSRIIPDEALRDLVENLEEAGFSDDQLRILRTAARRYRFRVRQVREILEVIDFEDDRLEAVRILWPRVVDKERGHELYEVFDFSDSREALERILEEDP